MMDECDFKRRGFLGIIGGTTIGIVGCSTAAAGDTVEQISYGDRISGQLTEESLNNDRYDYYDEYVFEAEGGDVVSIEVRPDILDEDRAQIALYDPEGERVATDGVIPDAFDAFPSPSGEKGNAVIQQWEIGQRDGGEYTIIASGVRSNEDNLFSYELLLYEGTPTNQHISYGDEITFNLSRDDRYKTRSDIGYYRAYSFEAQGGDEVSIELRPEIIDEDRAQIVLYDPEGERVASDGLIADAFDAFPSPSGEKGNAVISNYEIGQRDGGEYTVVVSGARPNDEDNLVEYELLLYEGFWPDDIGYGDKIEGDLSRNSRYNRSSGYYEAYRFEAGGGDTVSIEMRPEFISEDLAELQLYDSEGDRIAEDRFQSGDEGNAVITLHEIEREKDSQYTIVATGNSDTDLFEYELFLYEGLPIDEEIVYGDSVESDLTRSDRYYDDIYINGYHETYGFEAQQGDEVSIEMRPDNELDDDAQLVLYDPDGDRIAEDRFQSGDDGTALIAEHDIEMDGTHTIVATGNQADELFSYTLNLGSGSEGGSDEPLANYANDEGVIDSSGLQDAFSDWQAGEIEGDTIQDAFAAWQASTPVV